MAEPPRLWVLNQARAGLIGWLSRYCVFLLFALLIGGGYGGLQLYRFFAEEIPDPEKVENYQREAPGITRIHSADGTMLTELAREHRAYTPVADIPETLIQAFMAAEDRRFFSHIGLDFRGLGRALLANIRSGAVTQGGSTITQQVAKSFLADQERTLARKIREAILSLHIESRLGKARILEIYLNKIFLGHGSYGIAAAASRYFAKDLDELSLAECALIAGLARAPSRYSPVANPERALKRRAVVLQDMVEAGFIDEQTRSEAAAEPLQLAPHDDPFRWRAPAYAEHVRLTINEALGPEATLKDGLLIETPLRLDHQQEARRATYKASRKLDRRQGYRGPVAHLSSPSARKTFSERAAAEYESVDLTQLSGTQPSGTYLGLVTEVKSRRAKIEVGKQTAHLPLRLAIWAAPYQRKSGVNDRKVDSLKRVLEVGDVVWVRPSKSLQAEEGPIVALEQTPKVEASLYTFEHHSGYVEAMIGGLDYDRSQYNRATQACRQPGSVFKAFYYALALDDGKWAMDSILEAKPWVPEEGEEWNPRNIDKTIDGKVLLRTAFIKSLNTPSIRLFLDVGAQRVVDWLRRFGVRSKLIADKGLSLGASCMRIDELSRAFGVFARGGSLREPVYLRRVTDKRGQLRIDNRDPYDGAMDVAGRLDRMAAATLSEPEQRFDRRTMFLISRLMREVVTSGTSTRANTLGIPVAGKSGTASGRFKRDGQWADLTTDTWFVGHTSKQVTAAWMGFDDRNERSLGDEEASYTTAIPMWTDFMKAVVEGRKFEAIPNFKPPGVTSKVIDATRGGPPIEGMPQATVFYR